MSAGRPATVAPAPRTRDTALPDTERDALDAAIGDLEIGAKTWVHLTLEQRARLMERLHASVVRGRRRVGGCRRHVEGPRARASAARRGLARRTLRRAHGARRRTARPC